jgi:hypothetical protein
MSKKLQYALREKRVRSEQQYMQSTMHARKVRKRQERQIALVLLVFCVLLALLATTGCNKVSNEHIEVRVIDCWTTEDFNKAMKAKSWSISVFYPHTIVETTATKQRYRLFGNPLGTNNEVFFVNRKQLR